jgi:hypothetical protein
MKGVTCVAGTLQGLIVPRFTSNKLVPFRSISRYTALSPFEGNQHSGGSMALSRLMAVLQDAPAASGGTNTLTLVCGGLAVILIVIIIMRRRARKKLE